MASLICTNLLKSVSKAQPVKVTSVVYTQKCNIMGKTMRSGLPPPPPKPKPFPYQEKDYTYFRSLIDRTTHRLDENSKVLVVEGPPAVGKTAFAQKLAEELEMKHFPEANMDYHYIINGQDLRQFDPKIPEDVRTFDHTNFCRDPSNRLAANYQIMMYTARYGQYIDALAHLLNTGQGVVLERSPYSDFVFLEAMFAKNFISKGARNVYYDIKKNTIFELLRPHLVIYLDVPVDGVLSKIKSRNLPHEQNSKALTKDYLSIIEEQYKQKYLREISTHAELLVYDWSAGGDAEVVVEDIERLNFEQYTVRDEPKMKDWRLPREVEWADKRMIFTNCKAYLMNCFNIPHIDVPELITSADDDYERTLVIQEHPAFKYMEGYNAEYGDTGILTKTKMPKYSVAP